MELVKKTAEYSIYKKRSGRYGIQTKKNKWINGDKKSEILSAAGLIKVVLPKKEEAPAEEAAAQETETTPEAE